ncbi:MAG: ATP phosphoribosyltransferase regulatory subunit [Clostridia bacterium]|nr:ATP phosphoribosyltransferase regulatory subunit [Clostridia bacterium]
MIKKFKLPSGIQDHLPIDCYSRRVVENKLLDCFKYYGYSEIQTPVLERYELFDSGVGKVELNKLFKVTDVDGDLLVLRPDITMPISRIVCTKLSEGSQRLCYLGKSFSALETEGKLREFTQAGVEIMGTHGDDVDIEIVMLAIKSLIAVGLEDFQIELGHVGFFKGLLNAFNVGDDDRDVLINSIESKNGIKLYNLSHDMDKLLPDTLAKLPMLFGGVEVLDVAQKMCLNDEMKHAVHNLKAVYDGIKKLGYDKYVCFDMSSVGKMKYYSGMVMRGINKNLGRPMLSGGRYDGLCDSFGKHVPAVGFAIGIGYLSTALDNQNKLQKMPEIEVVVGYAPEFMDKAEAYVDKLRSKGINAICSFATDEAKLKKSKKAIGAKRAVYLSKDGEKEI